MAFPAHIAYVAFGGLPGGEQWTNTLRVTGGDAPYEGLDLVGAAQDCRADWQTFLAATGAFTSQSSLQGVRAYVYDTNGVLIEQAESQGAQYNGTDTVNLPNQIAVVASLLTERPGRRYRGRLYLPLLGIGIGADNRVSSAATGTVATAMATLLQQAGTWGFTLPDGELRAAVVSKTYGTSEPIVEVRVGNVLDTQRRRRNGLTEVYSSAGVVQ